MPAHKGNKYAQKWELEELEVLFINALEYAEGNKDCLSLADAINHIDIPYSTYDYQAEKYDVLGRIKKDTMTAITRRINKKALQGDFQPTASIWRMKQLGEKDRSEVMQTNVNVTPPTPEELKKAQDEIDNNI